MVWRMDKNWTDIILSLSKGMRKPWHWHVQGHGHIRGDVLRAWIRASIGSLTWKLVPKVVPPRGSRDPYQPASLVVQGHRSTLRLYLVRDPAEGLYGGRKARVLAKVRPWPFA